MGFTASFLMALALSVDALVCAVITGKKQFPPALRLRFALEMGLTFGLFQALMPIAGFYAGASLAALIAAFDHWAAFALLSVVGLKMLKDALFPEKEECCQKAPRLSLTLLMTLGIATSIDALALGFSIGLISDTIALFAPIQLYSCALRAGVKEKLNPIALSTLQIVLNPGFPSPDKALYKLSRGKPVAFEILVMPLALAIKEPSPGSSSKATCSAASKSFSVRRYLAGSKSLIVIFSTPP